MPENQSFKESEYPEGVSSRFVGISSASSQQHATGQHPCQGLYWTPTGKNPSVAFMTVHYNGDFSEHYLGPLLAARGYGFLGFNTRYRGMEDMFILENAVDDIGAGVEWMQVVGKAEKIVFIGNSGGGSLMAAYQAKAQKDPSLVPADLFIFLNAHAGRPEVLTSWLDPSVIDETDPTKTDPSLDMYNPANKVPYSQEFITRYRAAQRERNYRITAWAKSELKRLNAAGIPDRNFSLYRTMADLRFNDGTIDPSDRPVPSSYIGDPATANRGIGLLGRTNSLRTWLSMWSLEDSQCKIQPYASQFKLPTLVIQSTADVGIFPSDARNTFEMIASEDKELLMIPGGHFFEDVQAFKSGELNTVPGGHFSNKHASLRDLAADKISKWVQSKL